MTHKNKMFFRNKLTTKEKTKSFVYGPQSILTVCARSRVFLLSVNHKDKIVTFVFTKQ